MAVISLAGWRRAEWVQHASPRRLQDLRRMNSHVSSVTYDVLGLYSPNESSAKSPSIADQQALAFRETE